MKNPAGGEIYAGEIGRLIMDGSRIDPTRTKIVCEKPENVVPFERRRAKMA